MSIVIKASKETSTKHPSHASVLDLTASKISTKKIRKSGTTKGMTTTRTKTGTPTKTTKTKSKSLTTTPKTTGDTQTF